MSVFKAVSPTSISIPEVSENSTAIQTSSDYCSRNYSAQKDITLLENNFEKSIVKMMALPECKTISVAETFRSQDRQDCLYSIGRNGEVVVGTVVTYAKTSEHSKGTAMDLLYSIGEAKLRNCAKACENAGICIKIKQCSGATAKTCKCDYDYSGTSFVGIFWGGYWGSCGFNDSPHFEYISVSQKK